ncbi:MAG: hypothetical protein ACQEQO_04860 [Thermodesulfobacteriota bacterium]
MRISEKKFNLYFYQEKKSAIEHLPDSSLWRSGTLNHTGDQYNVFSPCHEINKQQFPEDRAALDDEKGNGVPSALF